MNQHTDTHDTAPSMPVTWPRYVVVKSGPNRAKRRAQAAFRRHDISLALRHVAAVMRKAA